MPTRHAFVDESGRGQRYYVCAAVTTAVEVRKVRRLAESLREGSQRRWHFAKERSDRRKAILQALVDSGLVRGWVGHGKGDDVQIRRRCLQRLAVDLVALRTDRLVVESREGRDEQDREVLYAALRPTGSHLTYTHRMPLADPALWVADAFAWSFGAGGLWRQTLDPVLDTVRDVGRA